MALTEPQALCEAAEAPLAPAQYKHSDNGSACI